MGERERQVGADREREKQDVGANCGLRPSFPRILIMTL